MSILNTFASKLFPEGDFQNIRANAPNQMSYNIDATRDLVKNQPFNPLAPAMAATFSLPYDTIQGIGRAFKNVKSEPGILDYDNIPNDITFADIGKSIAAENPIDSLLGRTYGATLGLGDKLTSYGKTISDAIIGPAYAPELDDIESIIEARKNREELNRIGSLALDDAGLNTAAMIDEFSQTSKPRFDLKNLLTNVKDKGVDMFGSGKDLVLRGIGSIVGGPVGSLIGSLIGSIKESPTDKVGLASFGGDYDPYGFKGQLTSGTLGTRQDPFGRNIVSAFGNYEQNRINELKELTQLQNLGLLKNQFKKDKLNFARNYLEKVKQEREQRQREAARRNFADVYRRADQQGFTGPGGGFDTSAADKAGTSLGSGQFSPSSSRGRSGY